MEKQQCIPFECFNGNTTIYIQYSLLGRTAASTRQAKLINLFCLRMGTELVPETLYSNELTRLCAREDYIESCLRESFKTYTNLYTLNFC
jgi:hypothetical protein